MLKATKRAMFFVMAASFLMVSAASAFAQTQTADVGFTPYSLFGFGELSRQGSSYNASMGGIGVGDRNVRILNFINPAAVTARDAKSFMLDFGLEQKNTYYAANAATVEGTAASGDVVHSASNTFNMHHIVASFPIYTKAAFKLGIAPYSNVGYNFRSYEESDHLVADMGNIIYTKTGQGGLYQTFVGAGVTLFKRLNLGADGYYYFGNINHYSNVAFSNSTAFSAINSGWTYVLHGFSGKFGLQWDQPLSKNTSLVIGATYKLGNKMKGDVTRFAYTVSSATDTVVSNLTNISSMNIPQEFAAGFSIRKADKWMFGFDYSYQDWRDTDFGIDYGKFSAAKMQSFRFGMEFTPNRYDIRYYFKQVTYRLGCYYENSYVSLAGHQINSQGVTFGLSLPVFRYYNSVTVGVDFGQKGTLKNDLIRERYFLFTVSFDLHDIWFIPTLYY